jgi:hypothetical protein
LVLQRKLVPQKYSSLSCGPFDSNLSASFDIPCLVPNFLVVVMQVFFFIFLNGLLLVSWQVVSNFGHTCNQSWTSFLWTWASFFNSSWRSLVVTNSMRRSSFTHNSCATIRLLYESNNLHDSTITTLLFQPLLHKLQAIEPYILHCKCAPRC